MNEIMSYIIIYTCLWWFLFFISLPIAIKEKTIADNEKKYQKQVVKTYMMNKIIIVSCIAAPISYYAKEWFDGFLLTLL